MHSISHLQKMCSATMMRHNRFKSNSASFGKTIGVIGMGMVGHASTKNLLRNGFNVTSILDIDLKKCDGFPCKVSPNARSLTEDVDIIVTALPKPHHVKSVFEGDDGILSGISEGKIWIDHSTTDYEQTQNFAKLVNDKKGHILEAPITGGLEALKKEQMTVLVAGEKDVFANIKPMLSSVYQQVLFTGPVGTALIPKVISNQFAAMTCIAAAEALLICKRAGIDMKTAFDAIRGSTGNSFVWETAIPMIFQGTYDPSFSLDLHCKDSKLVMDAARKHNVPVELLGHVHEIYHKALDKYGDDAPCYIPAKLLEDDLQDYLQSEQFKDWSYSIENVDGSAIIRHHGIELEKTGHVLPDESKLV